MNEGFFTKIDDLLTNAAFGVVSPISAYEFIANILLAAVVGFFLFWIYSKSSFARKGDKKFAILLLLITLLTAIMITFIKSSLVLSIGLIGALSIVRFRTPIKDPLDLSFIFAAITFGIGFGASQIKLASIGVVIFGCVNMIMSKFISKNSPINDYVMEVSYLKNIQEVGDFQKLLHGNFSRVAISRMELIDNKITVFFQICVDKNTDIQIGLQELRKTFSSVKIDLMSSGL